MKLTLIEISCPDTRALGIRGLSAYLESKGIDCTIIFIPPMIERMTAGTQHRPLYGNRLLNAIANLCKGSDLIGISVLSYYYRYAVQLTHFIKEKTKIPVIWGGYHAMGFVENSLEHADFVCIGEGERTLSDLIGKLKEQSGVFDTPNLAYLNNGIIFKNPLFQLIQNLDDLPFLDYRLNKHYVANPDHNDLLILDRDAAIRLSLMGPLSRITPHHHYQTFMSRGCPYNCAYCCESMIHDLYKGQKQMRRRSPENLVQEIQKVRKELDFIDAIAFSDDSFSEASDDCIESFAQLYKKEIQLPFSAQFSPLTLSQRKLDVLVDAGLRYAEVGIQSGSDLTKRLYRRNVSNDRILETCKMLKEKTGKIMPPDYHFIVDNPWETNEDLHSTLNLIFKIPKPRGIKVSSLVFYPGTELYEKAIKEDRFDRNNVDVFQKNFGALEPKPVNLIFFLADIPWIPKKILELLNRPCFIDMNSKWAKLIIKISFTLVSVTQRGIVRIKRVVSHRKKLSKSNV
ncbi:B12-binding domain-containing radical SAM protein [bacterium]|nr:B12-binding domain-containing radical SAM protein [candidate division CSSED10-310 bacterium]